MFGLLVGWKGRGLGWWVVGKVGGWVVGGLFRRVA